jgi:hypothetical protein
MEHVLLKRQEAFRTDGKRVLKEAGGDLSEAYDEELVRADTRCLRPHTLVA